MGEAENDIEGAATPPPPPEQPAPPGLAQAARVWARIGVLSFGGPAAQIALMHREIVATRGWVGERRFLHALSFCAVLPGPEAQQLVTYLGWLMHGVAGGLVAGGLFILPGAAVLLALSIVYVTFGRVSAVDGLFLGLQCAVLALVFQAVQRLAGRALTTTAARVLAMAAFAAFTVFRVPYPLVIAAAALLGGCLPGRFAGPAQGDGGGIAPGVFDRAPATKARRVRARRAGAAALILWLLPVAALQWLVPGRFAAIALFFSKMAVVTFGSAYAVLAYAAQDAVHAQHWLTAREMLSGLGLAETTPGPLILVLQFVGFIAGARAPGALSGIAGGVAGCALTLWVTFVPCFAYVFLAAPALEHLAGNRVLEAALAGVSASVVGVIASLGVWFAGHLLSGVNLDELHPFTAALAALGALLLFGLRQGPARTLAVCAAVGLLAARPFG